MPRFAQFSEAAADTLQAYYSAFAKNQFDTVMALWTDEDSACLIHTDGTYWQGLEKIGCTFTEQFKQGHVTIEPLEINAYESAGTVVYLVAEAHHHDSHEVPTFIFATYLMNREYGKWHFSHMHLSLMAKHQIRDFTVKLKQNQSALH